TDTVIAEKIVEAKAAKVAEEEKPLSAKAQMKAEVKAEIRAENAAKLVRPKAEKPLTYAEVAVELHAVMKVKGRDALIALLTEFSAKNGQEIKEADYPACVARAKEVVAE